MLQCFSAPELLLTKYRLKSVFVSSRVCGFWYFLSKSHKSVPSVSFDIVLLKLDDFLGQHSKAKSYVEIRDVFKFPSKPDSQCHRNQCGQSHMTDRRAQADL